MTTATILAGDALEVLRTLEAESVDACVTDPPYGETSLTWDSVVEGWAAEVLRVLKPSGSLWVFGSLRSHLETRAEFADWRLAQDVVWEKQNGSGFGSNRFRRVHEIAVHWYPAHRAWADIYAAPQRVVGRQRRGLVRRQQSPVGHRGAIGVGVYEFGDDRTARSVIYERNCHGYAIHPTQKPTGILETLIRYSVPPGGVVLDPFCGSGSTCVAAARSGRSAVGIELNPAYAAMARERIAGDAPLLNRVAP